MISILHRWVFLIVVGVAPSFAHDVHAQETWLRQLGGTADDVGYRAVATSDGGCFVAGTTSSIDGDLSEIGVGFEGVFVMRLDPTGSIVWKRVFHWMGINEVTTIDTMPDGGCVFAGSVDLEQGTLKELRMGDNDVYLARLDPDGYVMWARLYGGSKYDGHPLVATTPEGFIYTVMSSSSIDHNIPSDVNGLTDVVLMKLDLDGTIEWHKRLRGSDTDIAYDFAVAKDGGFLIAGTTQSVDGVFTRTNESANREIYQTDGFVMKLDTSASVQWVRTLLAARIAFCTSVAEASDGSVVVAGHTQGGGVDFRDLEQYQANHIFFVRYSADGTRMWRQVHAGLLRKYGPSVPNYTLHVDYRDRIVIAGGGALSFVYGYPDICILWYDLDGQQQWEHVIGGLTYDAASQCVPTQDSCMIIVGATFSWDNDFADLPHLGRADIVVGKLDSRGRYRRTTSVPVADPGADDASVNVAPSVASTSCTITFERSTSGHVRLELINAVGETVEVLHNAYADAGSQTLVCPLYRYVSGIYGVRLTSGSTLRTTTLRIVR